MLGFGAPIPIWVRDVNTGARLSRGINYPLASGGSIEVIRASMPGVFRPARVLVRISATGRRDSYHWINGVLSGTDIFVNFPAIHFGRMM